MKSVLLVAACLAALCGAGANAATMTKTFNAGPAIAGNTGPDAAMHKKKAMKLKMHKKAM